MADKKEIAKENTTSKNKTAAKADASAENKTGAKGTDALGNNKTSSQIALETSLEMAHNAAKSHFDHRKTTVMPTHQELRADADRAARIAENLHTSIAANTPQDSTSEVMRNDGKKAAQAHADIAKGADPLAAYAGYSAYAVPQPNSDNVSRNYYKEPLTYDKYTVNQDKNEYAVNYNLQELRPGTSPLKNDNQNFVSGASIAERSFSYNEKKSQNNTIVTTDLTLRGTYAPSSFHINDGQSHNEDFTTQTTSHYVYDKDDKLTEQTYHSTSSNVISDRKFVAHKNQDMSRGETKGYCHTSTDITASRNNPTDFAHTEYTKDGAIKEQLHGTLVKDSESYLHQKDNKVTDARHYKNTKGEWIYEGVVSEVDLSGNTLSSEKFSPQKAEKEFNNLQKTANKHIKDLTGVNGMAEYTEQLGQAKDYHNLNTMWNGHATSEDKAKTQQNNAEVAKKYADVPAAVVALKTRGGR